MSVMTDDDLERLLASAVALAPPPTDGPPALDGEADDRGERRAPSGRRFPRWLPAAAAVALALLLGRDVLDDPAPQAASDTAIRGETTAGAASATGAAAPAAGASGTADLVVPGSGGLAAGGGGGAGAAATGQPIGDATRIVHEGSVEVEVERGAFGPTAERVTSLATGLGGHVSASQTSEQGDAPRGTITVRVPASAFEQLLSEVRRLGDVRSVATSGTDVTAQYTDLEARLGALRASRDQLLLVLGEARAVPDILAVQDRLTSVQVEIDSLEGQRRLLEDRSAFGTLAVTVVEPGASEPPEALVEGGDGGLGGAWDEARRGFGNAVEWFVARSGKAAVLTAVALALYGLALVGWRRVRRTAI